MTEEERNRLDYDQTMKYYLHLSDVRFKLFGFLPLVTGIAVAALANVKVPMHISAVCLFGLSVTIGITIYDLRNTQIYDRLQKRAIFLEHEFGFLPHSEVTRKQFGGALQDRPPRRMHIIWHDLGLAIVYAASLAVWFYLALASGPWAWVARSPNPPKMLGVGAFVAFLVILLVFARLNDNEKCSHT